MTPTYPVGDHQELLVGLCYLDCDLYEPTKVALEVLVPHMPMVSVVEFDELALSLFPRETRALVETVGITSLRICRFAFTKISYAILD